MPQEIDWGGLLAAFGPTGTAIVALAWILTRSDFLKSPRSDAPILNKLDAMHRENETEFRLLRDRITKLETIVEERTRR